MRTLQSVKYVPTIRPMPTGTPGTGTAIGKLDKTNCNLVSINMPANIMIDL